MAKIEPFCGLRYNRDIISDISTVTAPPNDSISEEMRRELFKKSPYNIERINFCENSSDSDASESAAEFENWIEEGILKYDLKPAVYIYEQRFKMKSNPQSLKGIISLVKLEDYDKKIILPHQKTSAGSCEKRARLLRSVKANLSPIFSLYIDDDISISSIIVAHSQRKPDISFETPEGITQNLWVVCDEDFISSIQEKFKGSQIFIADGHHRYEAALKYRDEMHKKDGTKETMPYDYTMMALMPMYSSGLFVFPTHRLVKGTEHFDENILINLMTEDFKVSRIYFTSNDYEKVILDRISDVIAEKYFGLYTGKDYYYLLKPVKKSKTSESSDIYQSLEATMLNEMILEKYLGITEDMLENPQYVTYTRSAKEAIRQVQLQNYQCAFFLNSTRVHEMRLVAESGKMMPIKSTFFWPKTTTGLVMYTF